MVSEIGIKQYYEQFRRECLQELREAEAELVKIEKDIVALRTEILDLYLNIKNSTGVNIKEYKSEFYNIKYDSSSDLQSRIKSYVTNVEGFDPKTITARKNAVKVLTYIGLLKAKYEQNQFKNFALDKLKITSSDFRKYIEVFYKYGVSKCLLQGYGYRFNYGLGILLICNIQRDKPWTNVDVVKSNENKRKLIEQGLKPYDKKEAAIYKARGLKYDGVEYLVYRQIENVDKVILLKDKKNTKGKITFKPSKSDAGLKGYKIDEITKLVKTEEDVFKIRCGIRIKLLIYKKVVPGCSLKYIRDVKRGNYIREFNRQNRQRFQS